MVEQEIVRALERMASAFERMATVLENGGMRRMQNGGTAALYRRPPSKPFVPPTEIEVENYCKENGFDIDTHKFWSHYNANGWKRKNGMPINDWQGCVKFWNSNKR